MKIHHGSYEDCRIRLETPHLWFAWHPVDLGHSWVWLEDVTRWADKISWDDYGGMVWNYAPKAFRRFIRDASGTEHEMPKERIIISSGCFELFLDAQITACIIGIISILIFAIFTN